MAIPFVLSGRGNFLNSLTGAATSSSISTSITINSPPVISLVTVRNTTANTVAESGLQQINISFVANDTDGLGNLDNNSAAIIINKTGETPRINYSCVANATTPIGINYSCIVSVWYFDHGGDWTINVSIKDTSGAYGENRSTQLFLGTLTAMVMSPAALTWPTLEIGATNKTSNNDPITINNTGNKDIGLGGITITGRDLIGQTTPSDVIRAQNFSVHAINGTSSSCSGASCLQCNGTQLLNNTAQPLAIANITAGNNSINSHTGMNSTSSGQEDIFFCLRTVPSEIIRQVYNTTGNVNATAAWTIAVS